MTDVNYMGVAFYVAAFLISLSCVLYTLIQNRIDKPQKKFYISMVAILMFNAVTEAVIEAVTPVRLESAAAPFLLSLCKYFYFISHSAVLPMLGYYVLCVTGRMRRFTRKKHLLFIIPVLCVELLMITNPLHHRCYFYDGAVIYHRGWGVTALYAVSAFYIVFFIINLFSSWRAMTQKRRIAMSYFLVMLVSGIFVQMLFFNIRVELFAEALAYLGVLLTVEDEGDLIDNDTGIYNRKALRIDLDNQIANRQSFHVLCVKIENADIIRRVTGSANTDILSGIMYNELVRYVPRYYIYTTSPDTFVLTLVKEDRRQALDMTERLSERFEQSFSLGYTDVMLTATVMLALVPDDIDNTEEIFNMADGTLPTDHKNRIIGKEDLGYLLRRRAVEAAIQRGLANGGFEVYYQPTFSGNGAEVQGAEALVRLHDEKLGNLFPDEFIPLSEQIGLIGEVDDFVLTRVCSFIAGGVPQSLGIKSINVNLSVRQCVKPGFVEHLTAIVDKSGAERSRINFEITESVDSNDFAVMRSVITGLKQNGFRVYMDDYGTGYSNVQALFSMGFNVVKIDKSILWGAEKSELGRIILENNVRMLRQMRLGIMVEGVETGQQLEFLKRLGVDHLQGFLFSKPLPEKELAELFKN